MTTWIIDKDKISLQTAVGLTKASVATLLYKLLVLSISGLMILSLHPLSVQAGSLPAQPDLIAIDAFITSQMRAHRIPGLALAITHEDEIVYLQGYGTAGKGRDMTVQTPLYIASVTKSFTALATMQLVEQGRLELDAPVQTYLPWFKVADQAASKQITIRHLLNQTSGMSNAGYVQHVPPTGTLEDAVRDLQHAQLTAPVGTTFEYFEGNFRTLGLLIETVSGLSYGEYIQQHIFDPLEMNRSFISPEPAEQAGLAQGYNAILGFPLPRETHFLAHGLPGGFIITTAEDMAHYLIAQNDGGRYAATAVLSPEGISEMHRPATETGGRYAMGWFTTERYDTRVIYHPGEMRPTFYAQAMLMPEEGYSVALLINQYGGMHTLMAYPKIMDGVVNLLLGNQPANGVPMSLFYGIITVIISVHLVQFIRKLRSLPRWEREIKNKPGGKVALQIAMHFFIPLGLFLGIPFLYEGLIGFYFSWSSFFTGNPDFTVWIIFAIVSDLVLGIAKTWLIMPQRRDSVAQVQTAV